MSARKTIGVMGGMGPMATVEFFRRLVVGTRALRDQDHLHILIDNDPSVPDRTAALLADGPDPTGALVAMARCLETAGADVLAIPCNTAHAYLGAIRRAVGVPVIDMIGETAQRVKRGPVGLLATEATVRTGLYAQALESCGLRLILPDEAGQRTVNEAIQRIKAGWAPAETAPAIRGVVASLASRGAVAAIAGCTELSLISGCDMGVVWVDALAVLVEAALREANGGRLRGEARGDRATDEDTMRQEAG